MKFKLSLKLRKEVWLAILIAFLVFGFSLTSLAAINYNRTIFGLALGGIKAGGIEKKDLEPWLAGQVSLFNQQKVSLVFGEKSWSFSPDDLGLEINIEETADNALALGHGSWPGSLGEQIRTLLAGQNLPLSYAVNQPKFQRSLDTLAAIETPVKNSSLKYESAKNDFVILPAQNGALIDRQRLIADILGTFDAAGGSINLYLAEAKPQITESEISQVLEPAKQLLASAPYFLQSTDATWRVDKAELAGWISSTPSKDEPQKAQLALDISQIKNFLVPLSASINREPVDAKLTSENGELKFAVLAQNGEKLNVEASAQKVAEDILAGKKNIYLLTDSIAPKISNQTTKELGLLTLLGKGESNFSGSPTNRRVNIKVGATKLNGFLIKPGEEFSFGRNIGEIDAANGWVPELVIKNKQTVPEYGGGLCQVSTTLFRAAVIAGLKVTERHPHAYPVHYYDPPGFDATVYPPSPDLKFLNDTPGHLLLQTRIEGNKLFFEIYGTADGREVKIKGPTTIQKYSSGALKATLTQEIWRDGQLERKQVFNSSYNSPALYPNPYAATPTPSPTPVPSPVITPTPTPLNN